jgi:hypothetical protein
MRIACSAFFGGSSLDATGNPIAGTGSVGLNGLTHMGDFGGFLFSSISGGVGSSLGGGNFWQGAAIGLIVSGLNHAMKHISIKKYLIRKIESTGRNPDDPAIIESSQLDGFAEEILPGNMDINDNPSFVLKDQILGKDYNRTGQEAYGETPVYSDDNYKTYKPTGIINISRIALKSWLTLASTMGHELNHYYHFYSGIYNGWLNKYGLTYADARSEYMSQHWEQLSGGIPTMSIMQQNWNTMKSFK